MATDVFWLPSFLLGKARSHFNIYLDSKLTGLWRSETGLPQGGSLSVALFVALLVQLHDALADKDCGLDMHLPDGTSMRMILLAYIDDIVLLADSEAKLQKSLAILEKWARKIRTCINVALFFPFPGCQ